MLTFKEIKETTDKYGIEKIDSLYEQRQKHSINSNNHVLRIFLEQIYQDVDISDDMLMPMFENSLYSIKHTNNNKIISRLNELLKKYHYNSNYEIAMFVLLIDAYLTGTYSYERFLTCLNYWTTYSDFYVKKGKMFLETSKGTMPIQRASHILKLPEMTPIERLQKCHILTSASLQAFSNLNGIYFNLPLCFTGTLDHSALLSADKKTVYDLANDVAIPYEVYNKYNKPSFIISGNDFNMLSEQFYDEYGQEFSIDMLETISRIRRR